MNKYRLMTILVLALVFSCREEGASGKQLILSPYIQFIEKQNTSAKDYILEQFKTYDFVVLTERDHADITQYDLFLDVISDARFTDHVKHIFLEIGTARMQNRMNSFLSKEGLSEAEIHEEVKYIQRNAWYFPLWEKHNYAYFFERLYQINQEFKDTDKIKVYPSGLMMNWNTTRTYADMKEAHKQRESKDSIMALHIMHDIDSLAIAEPNKEHKALLILNYSHAFNNKFTHESACANYLFEKYNDRIANILVNTTTFMMSDDMVDPANDGKEIPIQDGKWDAAFKIKDNPSLGFDFVDSPFGKDYFDYYPYVKHGYVYKDIFDGYVFYKPISEFKRITGYPGLLDDGFREEFRRRLELFMQYKKNDPSYRLDSVSNFLNKVEEVVVEDLDTIQYLIDQRIDEYVRKEKNTIKN